MTIPTDADWIAGLVAIGHTEASAAALLDAPPKPSNDGDAGHDGECRTCRGAGELWDGRTHDHDTGQPTTHTCHACNGAGERTPA